MALVIWLLFFITSLLFMVAAFGYTRKVHWRSKQIIEYGDTLEQKFEDKDLFSPDLEKRIIDGDLDYEDMKSYKKQLDWYYHTRHYFFNQEEDYVDGIHIGGVEDWIRKELKKP